MKYYIDSNNQVFGFELDGSQDHLIKKDMKPYTLPDTSVEDEKNKKIADYYNYLASTDHKVLPYYEAKPDENINDIIAKRKEARDFIRANTQQG